MPFNGSGVFERLYSWVTDRDAGTKILAARVDAETDGMVSGLNQIIDGTQAFKAPVRTSFGTAAAPSHSFESDPDTGMFRKALNAVGWSTAGVERMSIDGAGLVTVGSVDIKGGNIDGTVIGATAPAAGTFAAINGPIGTVTPAGASFTTVGTSGQVTAASLVATTADINGGTFDGIVGGTTPAAGTFASLTATTADINGGTIDGTVIGGASRAAGSFTALTSNGIDDNATSTAITIDASENVGIGTATPAYPLEIKGASDTYMQLVTPNNTGASGLFFGDSDASGVGRVTYTHVNNNMLFHTNSTTRMVIDDTGRVGIGTTTPDSALDIDTGSASQTAVTLQGAGATSAKLQLGLGMFSAGYPTVLGTANGLDLGTSSSAPVRFFINSAEGMRLDSSGRLLVATTTAVSGVNMSVARGTTSAIRTTTGTATSAAHIQFENPNGVVGSVSTSASSTFYNTSSDDRLKENITPIQGAGDIVKAMRPCTYTFKADGDWADGFLAHELQELHPVAVTGSKDAMRDEEYEVTPAVEATFDAEGVELTPAEPAVMGTRSVPDYQGVDYSKLTPILTAALQEALKKIDALTARIAALEGAA